MNLLCVNCRGCGQPEAVQELREVVEQYKPAVVFLSETRLDKDRALALRLRLGLANGQAVGAAGQSGGLALFWRGDVTVAIQSLSKSHIDVLLSCDKVNVHQWRFTGFYGEPRRELRKNSWYLLRFLRAQSAASWLCAGDFNEVLNGEEHFGINDREAWQMNAFQDVVTDCGFSDLGFKGLPYTWDNKQDGDRNVKARLDRAFGDDRFLDVFGDSSVQHIQLAKSDHCGLLVAARPTCSTNGRQGGGRSAKPFRCEDMWFRHARYKDFVKQVWDPGLGEANLEKVGASLRSMQGALRSWEHEVFGSVRKQVRATREAIQVERSTTLYRGPTEKERELVEGLSELLSREEAMERQRSRVTWLKEGDRNTGFFQAKARARGRTNRIRVLKREDGSEATEQWELEQLAIDFYQQLFAAQEQLEPERVCRHVPRKVTDQMNSFLDREFSSEEVEKALFMMHPGKAPGVDGFNAGFFQRHWDTLKGSVTAAVLGFLNGGEMPEEINQTLLVLIPKVMNPQDLAQYRPISLCNVLYKICSKTLANRLRGILDEVVSEEQSAFVPGRLITDNVLIAYECIHYLRNKKGKSGACAIKLDMAKAYDRVEWEYLRSVMAALGFSHRWMDLVMKCVTTVSFSVRVNGQFSQVFKPSRGIRQGDLISPYLFLLCAEGYHVCFGRLALDTSLGESGWGYMHPGFHISFLQMIA